MSEQIIIQQVEESILLVKEEADPTTIVVTEAENSVLELVSIGPQGPSGSLTIGSITTLEPGESATVENVGTPTNAILNIALPRGFDGEVTAELEALFDATVEAANQAQTSAETASLSADQAADSATAAAASASTAQTQASVATTKATESETSATAATTKASEASSSATAAAASASTASTKAAESVVSAGTASTKASEASTSATNAAASATTASQQATIATTKASEASSSASSAAGSATTSSAAATTATTQATAASQSAGAAQTSATNAASSATAANSSKDAAALSASTASTKATEASTSAGTAQGAASTATTQAGIATTKASEASSSASAAAISATEAAESATSANTGASTATTKASEASASSTSAAFSATTATTKATEASTSAADALDSQNAAATSATTATTKASEAAESASTASTQAGIATTKASEASTSATTATTQAGIATTKASEVVSSAEAAATAATTATTQAGIATTKSQEAASSATGAAASALSASGSATTATSQASTATSKASEAAASASTAVTQAGIATTKAGEAASSATAASSAQVAAEAARDQTLAAFDSFDDRYLGSKSSDPTLDNDGNALVSGALYFNTSPLESGGGMKVFDGSMWRAAYASLTGVLLAANNLSDLASASTARANLGLGNVENKSSATIRGELTSGNVSTALGFTPANAASLSAVGLSGSYADLLNKPTLFSGAYADLIDKPTLFSGSYADLTNKPSLFDGAFGSLSGKPTTLSGYGITDAQALDADLTAIAALAGTSGFLKKTAANTWALDTATYLTGINSSQVTTALGFTPYNATNPSGYITGSASITGNAATATALQTARTINGVSFNGTANITVADSTKLPLAGGTMTGAIAFAAGQTWPTFNQSTTGNAATATVLQTARLINGVSFNGSADITIADGTKLPLAGGTMTGGLTVGGDLLVSANSGNLRTIGLASGTNTTLVIQSGAAVGAGANIELTSGSNCYIDATITRVRSQNAVTTFLDISASATNVVTGALQQGGNQVLHAANYTSYSPSLTGTGASGSWGISITGTAASITGTYAGTLTSNQVINALGFTPGNGNVTLTGSETLTNKTVEKLVLNDGYTEEVFAITDGTTVSLDPNNGSIQTWTLGGNRVPTATNFAAGQSMTLMIDDGTAYSIDWATAAVNWVGGGSGPDLATSGLTVIELWKVGSTLYGALIGEVG
jgi:hypothetical protein